MCVGGEGVTDLCVALGLTTIAEGVEHEDQLVLLQELGCDNVQGYLFAEPMPGAEFAQFLRDSSEVPISLSRFGAWSGSGDRQAADRGASGGGDGSR